MNNDYRKLMRSTANRMICGVCGGIGEYLNIDPTLVRLIWLLCSLASYGAGHLYCCGSYHAGKRWLYRMIIRME